MPQRQQTQGDFGLRPTKVTQGITDVYHAPSIPKPDMSGLQAIANLSKTAMGLVQEQHRLDVRDAKFAQEEAEAHEKTGREFGEAHPFAEFPRGSTEAMILGGRKGRAAAMQSMYRNAVKEGFPSYLLANPEEATNPDAFFNFADEAYNEWASTHAESLGELGLQEFASTHIEWRHHQGAIHGNKAIAQGVEDFIGVSDTIMPQTLTELESINSAIDGYSDSQIIALFPEEAIPTPFNDFSGFKGNFPLVKNKDGKESNVVLGSYGVEIDGKEMTAAIPTMRDGKKMTPAEIDEYIKSGNENFPVFETLEEAESWIKASHGRIRKDGSVTEKEEFNVEEHRQLLREQYGTVPMQNLQNYLGEAHRMGDDVLRQAVDRISTDLIKEMTDGMNPIAAHTMLLNLQTGSGAFIDRPEVNEKYREAFTDFTDNVASQNIEQLQRTAVSSYLDLNSDVNYATALGMSGMSDNAFASAVEQNIYANAVDEEGNFSASSVIASLIDKTDLPKAPETKTAILGAYALLMDDNVASNPSLVERGLELYRYAMESVGVMDKLNLNDDQKKALTYAVTQSNSENFSGYEAVADELQETSLVVKPTNIPTDDEFRSALNSESSRSWLWWALPPVAIVKNIMTDDPTLEEDEMSEGFMLSAQNLLINIAQRPDNRHLDKEQLMELTFEELENLRVVSRDGTPFQLSEGTTIANVDTIEEHGKTMLWRQIQQDEAELNAIHKEIGNLTPTEFYAKYPNARLSERDFSFLGSIGSIMRVDIESKQDAISVFESRHRRTPLSEVFDNIDEASDLPIELRSAFNITNSPTYSFFNSDTGVKLHEGAGNFFKTESFMEMLTIANQATSRRQLREEKRAEEFKKERLERNHTYFKQYPM